MGADGADCVAWKTFGVQVKIFARLSRFLREPGAAGSARDLKYCTRTGDAVVCRWARARMSRAQIAQLGRDLEYIVEGREATVHVHWGRDLLREYRLDEFADLPLESLRKANLIGISSFGANSGASVSLSTSAEPSLEAVVRGSDDVAQKVKDAVELGNWNPASAHKIRLILPGVVTYSMGAMLLLIQGDLSRNTTSALSVAMFGVLLATVWLSYRLWPLVEIYASEKVTVGSILRSAVPILAGAASIAATMLTAFGD